MFLTHSYTSMTDLLANVVCFFVECLPEDGRKKPKR